VGSKSNRFFPFFSEIHTAVQSSVKRAGYRSLWIGLGATMLRDIPFSSKLPVFCYEGTHVRQKLCFGPSIVL